MPAPEHTRAAVLGCGAALPERVIGNDYWSDRLDTSDEWIHQRTGIRERRWLDPEQPFHTLATESVRAALADAGQGPEQLDHVIVATISSDQVTPGTAPLVQDALGAPRAGAFDVNAGCTGFVYALDQAAALVESGRAGLVAVCGGDAMSRLTDHEDRSTAVLFGDAAGALIVGPATDGAGIGAFVMGSDGSKAGLLEIPLSDRKLRMHGRGVYLGAVESMVGATRAALDRAGLEASDLDLFVAHQANGRIIEAAAAQLGVEPGRVFLNVERYANTSAGTIPVALWEAERDGRLQPGNVVCLAAFGAGFVWGAGVLEWKRALAPVSRMAAARPAIPDWVTSGAA